MHINTSSPQPELTQPNKASELQQLLEKIKAKLKHPQVVFTLVVGFILFAGLGLTLVQMKKSTENRSQASGGDKPQVQLSSTNDLSHPSFSANKAPGDEFTLYLNLNSHNHQLIASDIVVTYPADKLQLTAGPEINSADNYAVTKTTHRETGKRGQARVLIGAKPGHPLSQVVQVGQIKFKVKDDAPDADINITISANGTKLAPKTGDIITGNALEVQNFGLNISRPDQNCSFDANVCNNEAALKIPKSECLALKDLYCYTKGDSWAHKDNWGAATDVNKWYGVDTHSQHVVHIQLGNNNLNGIIPPSIGALIRIEEIKLTNSWHSTHNTNHVTGIPKEIATLSNLLTLELGEIGLTGAVPDLSTLSKLRILNLSENDNLTELNISQIPSSIVWLSAHGNTNLAGSVNWSLPNTMELLNLEKTHLTGTVCGPKPSQEFRLNDQVQYSETCTGATATPTPTTNQERACSLPVAVKNLTASHRATNNVQVVEAHWEVPQNCQLPQGTYLWWQAVDKGEDGSANPNIVSSNYRDNFSNNPITVNCTSEIRNHVIRFDVGLISNAGLSGNYETISTASVTCP